MNNNQELHLVLGGAGAIGSEVIAELRRRNVPTKAVERQKRVAGVETIHADLLDFEEFSTAAKGATHLYVCVGLPYSGKIWERDWPRLMKNAIEVCRIHKVRLIFFDNMYMYGPSLSVPCTEDHTQSPQSKKGKVRKEIADLLIKAFKAGTIQGVIGRSADFYGPNAVNSVLYISFIENILKNKRPIWLGNPGIKHTYAYTKDNARALVALALDETCYGQVWHLPTGDPLTIEELMRLVNQHAHTSYTVQYVPRMMLYISGLFVPIIKEVREMLYQFDYPYVISSEKFKEKFPDFKVTPYDQGIQETLESFKK
jgi:nucleoside-diphosphate-sugar epimerase